MIRRKKIYEVQGTFCATTAVNNEEYRKVLKRRNVWIGLIAAAGLLIAGSALAAADSGAGILPEYILGVYCGFGTGLVLGMAVLFVRNMVLLNNEEKLKKSRLENADERLEQIGSKASQTALKVLLIVGSAAALIGGIYEPVLVKALLFGLDTFLFSYLAALAYYKKKM